MSEISVTDVLQVVLIAALGCLFLSYLCFLAFWLDNRRLLARVKAYAPTVKNKKAHYHLGNAIYDYRKTLQ